MNENLKNMELQEEELENVAGGEGVHIFGVVKVDYGCLTVRETPSSNGKILGGKLNGSIVQIIGECGNFYAVYVNCEALPAPNSTPAFSGTGFMDRTYITNVHRV